MTVIYVIGAVGITFASLGALFAVAGGKGAIVTGPLLYLFGNLYWRIFCEFVMVLFRMNDSLQSIDGRGKRM